MSVIHSSDQLVISYQLSLVQILILAHREELVCRVITRSSLGVGKFFAGVDVETVKEVGVADGLQGLSVDGDVTDGQINLFIGHFSVFAED
jgi:hypothetical protein